MALVTTNLPVSAMVTHVLLYHWNDVKLFVLSLNPWNKQVAVIHDVVGHLYSSNGIKISSFLI